MSGCCLPGRCTIFWSPRQRTDARTPGQPGATAGWTDPEGAVALRAIVLSAGQGKRLLALAAEIPECLLAGHRGPPVLLHQLPTPARCCVALVRGGSRLRR